jgi:P-type E1-E2 ATPase
VRALVKSDFTSEGRDCEEDVHLLSSNKGKNSEYQFFCYSDSFPSWHMVAILTIMQLLCNVQLIQRGDLLKVPPAAKVPADGIAVCGASPVNKSMITGESSPAANKMGDSVIDGTLNMNGVMHIQAMRVGRNTALAQIINLVEAAQMTKAPIQKFADCVCSYNNFLA